MKRPRPLGLSSTPEFTFIREFDDRIVKRAEYITAFESSAATLMSVRCIKRPIRSSRISVIHSGSFHGICGSLDSCGETLPEMF